MPVKACPLSRRIVSTTHAPLRATVGRMKSGHKAAIPAATLNSNKNRTPSPTLCRRAVNAQNLHEFRNLSQVRQRPACVRVVAAKVVDEEHVLPWTAS